MINKTNLDKKICDCEKSSENTQTYREYIRETEEMVGMSSEPIDLYSNEELEYYLEELDYYWEK